MSVRRAEQADAEMLMAIQLQQRLYSTPNCPKSSPDSPCAGAVYIQCGLCTRHHNEFCVDAAKPPEPVLS